MSCHRPLSLKTKFLHFAHRENGSFEVLSLHEKDASQTHPTDEETDCCHTFNQSTHDLSQNTGKLRRRDTTLRCHHLQSHRDRMPERSCDPRTLSMNHWCTEKVWRRTCSPGDPTPQRQCAWLLSTTSRKVKSRRKCWKLKMMKRRKVN